MYAIYDALSNSSLRNSIMNDDNDYHDDFHHNFEGPTVFYEYLSTRLKGNRLFLKRNTDFRRTSTLQTIRIQVSSFSAPQSGRLSIFLLRVHCLASGKSSIDLLTSFSWIASKSCKLENEIPFDINDMHRSKTKNCIFCLLFDFSVDESIQIVKGSTKSASTNRPIQDKPSFSFLRTYVQSLLVPDESCDLTYANSHVSIFELPTFSLECMDGAHSKKRKITDSRKNIIQALRYKLTPLFAGSEYDVEMKQISPNFKDFSPNFKIKMTFPNTNRKKITLNKQPVLPFSKSLENLSKPGNHGAEGAKSVKILFHFVMCNNEDSSDGPWLVKTEPRDCLECPWCDKHSLRLPISSASSFSTSSSSSTVTSNGISVRKKDYLYLENYAGGYRYTKQSYRQLQRLSFHLKCTHHHFTYEFVVDANMDLHVTIRRVEEEYVSKYDNFNIKKSLRQSLLRQRFLRYLQEVPTSLWRSQFDSKKQLKTVLATDRRPYYNPITGIQLTEEECEIDRDDKLGVLLAVVLYSSNYFEYGISLILL